MLAIRWCDQFGFALQAVKYFNPQTCVTLVRVSRDHYDKLWSAMALMTSLKKRECIFRVIHLAGTIKSCTATKQPSTGGRGGGEWGWWGASEAIVSAEAGEVAGSAAPMLVARRKLG